MANSNKIIQIDGPRISISKLRRPKHNPRRHPQSQINAIANSIKEFGFIAPIIIDQKKRVIVGNARIEAAKVAGLTEVAYVVVNHLSKAQIRAYRLADNRLTELATWDEALVRQEIAYLVDLQYKCEIDFSVSVTGFTDAECDILLSQTNVPVADEMLPEISHEIPVTQPGDMWLAGDHRILCGDAKQDSSCKILTSDFGIDLICMDPPYNVEIDGFATGKGATKHKEFAEASGEMSSTAFTTFLFSAIENAIRNLKAGGLVYICMDWRHVLELTAAASKAGLQQINLCVWDKGTGGMGSLYRSQHELVFVFKKPGKSHVNNVQLGKFGRNRTNVWSYPGANSNSETRKILANHPTPKPVAMIADILLDASLIGDVVLDPFLGSGTALLAAEEKKRICYGIEIDPAYVDLAIERWQQHTGLDAINAKSGVSFNDIKERFLATKKNGSTK